MLNTYSAIVTAFMVAALGAGALVACGGSSAHPPSGSGAGDGGAGGEDTGTGPGITFSVASQIGSIAAASTDESCQAAEDGGQTCVSTNVGQGAVVFLTNRADLTCAALQGDVSSGLTLANLDLLELEVTNESGAVVAGTFPIVAYALPGSQSGAFASLITSTATCAGTSLTAIDGSITLTQVSATSLVGSYTVTFETQGTFTGSFAAPLCTLPNNGNTPVEAEGGVCH
jgi:hypothetical protein